MSCRYFGVGKQVQAHFQRQDWARSRLAFDRDKLFEHDTLFSAEWAERVAAHFEHGDDVQGFFRDPDLVCLEFGADGYQPFIRRVHESIVIGMRYAYLLDKTGDTVIVHRVRLLVVRAAGGAHVVLMSAHSSGVEVRCH